MVNIIKRKIEELTYQDANSINELNRHLGAAIFIVEDDSRSIHPIQPEYVRAITGLSNIKKDGEADFNKKKEAILTVINTLVTDKKKWDDGKPNMNTLLHGEGRATMMDIFQVELFIIEQNNIDFFKERESHLPSQPHDRLSSHMLILFSGNNVHIQYISSDLPESIKDEISAMLPKIGLMPQPA